jgi:uncharacterized protein (DUF433 family)
MLQEKSYTPAEAAVLSDLPLASIHKAIDEGPLESARSSKPGRRTLTETDVFYLAATGIFDPGMVQLTDRARERLRAAIGSSSRTGKLGKIALLDGLELDINPVVAKVRSKMILLHRAKRMVVVNPRIRGGEPVIRGTRIGVYEVAGMVKGATDAELEEILAGYPALKREQLHLATIFAAAHPRRGRPPKHPWHRMEAEAGA